MSTKKQAPAKPRAKTYTPAEAMAEAKKRAQVWATPVKKPAPATQAQNTQED